RSVEPRDGVSTLVDNAGVLVAEHSAAGTHIARVQPDGVKRRLIDRPKARIGLVGGIAPEAFVVTLAAMEVVIDPLSCESVETLHRGSEHFLVDVTGRSQVAQAVCLLEETTLQPVL